MQKGQDTELNAVRIFFYYTPKTILIPRFFPLTLQLDYKVDDKMLRDVFKIAGKVVSVEISKDQDGKSRGFGVVGEFEKCTACIRTKFFEDFYFVFTLIRKELACHTV